MGTDLGARNSHRLRACVVAAGREELVDKQHGLGQHEIRNVHPSRHSGIRTLSVFLRTLVASLLASLSLALACTPYSCSSGFLGSRFPPLEHPVRPTTQTLGLERTPVVPVVLF